MSAHEIQIAAMGMSSSLGPLIGACAAFRAGITRARASLDFFYPAVDDNAQRPLNVCAIASSTFGFSGIGRLVAILYEVWLDILSRVEPASVGPASGLYLVLPDPLALELPVEPEVEGDLHRRTAALGRWVLTKAFEHVGWRWPGRPWRFFAGGPAAFARALQAAQEELLRGNLDACFVGAVDSLLDPTVLERLLFQGRLKVEDNPVGLVPGEAGIFVLLRRSTEGAPPDGAVLGTVAVASAGAMDPLDGRALAGCVKRAAREGTGGSGRPVLISDHNGEEERAREWGMALLHLQRLGPGWAAPVAWMPATSFGDVGLASGALGLCIAARSLERGYAPAGELFVLSSSDDGERAAVRVAASGA